MRTLLSSELASRLPPLGVCTALLAGELPVPGSEAPAWIKVTPRGEATTRDGRRYSFSPEALVARFEADGIDVPADLNHAIALKGARGEDAAAIGWAKKLQARPDGTFARIEWLPAGKATLAARTHRYVSPTFHHTEDGVATWLHSISLLAAPALTMPALAGARPGGTGTTPSSLREALGLDATADEAACLAAIGELRTAFVPVSLYADTIASLNAALAANASQKGEARAAGIGVLMEQALKAGKIVPAERAHYEALCTSDAGFQAVSLLMAAKPQHALFRPSGLDGRTPDAGGAETPEALAARASRYRQTQAAAGSPVSQVDAIGFCHANPAAGR